MSFLVESQFFAFVVIALILVFMIGLYTFMRKWTRVPPEKAAIIYGRKKKIVDPTTGSERIRGYRIVSGGATLVVPVLEKLTMLELNVFQLPIGVTNSYSRDGVPVSVEAIANVKIDGSERSLEIAAEQFGGMDETQIHSTIEETLQGHLRAIIGKLTPEEIYQDRQKFGQEVQDAAQPDLAEMGFKIVTFPIKDVRDDQGYLDALGVAQIAEVKKNAEIARAEADREKMVKTSVAIRLGKEAQFSNEQEVAQAQRDLEVRKSNLKAESDRALADADLAGPIATAERTKELKVAQVQAEEAEIEARTILQGKERQRREAELKATMITQADAERERLIIEAEAQREAAERTAQAQVKTAEGEALATERIAKAARTRLEEEGRGVAAAEQARLEATAAGHRAQALAEAAGREAELLAEAKGERARLMAEAEGKEKLAEALAKLDETGKLLQVLEAAPEVAEAIGNAIAKALGEEGASRIFAAASQHLSSIDKVQIIDLGQGQGQDAVSRFAGSAPRFVFDLLTQAKALGLEQVLEKWGISSELLSPVIESLAKAPHKADDQESDSSDV